MDFRSVINYICGGLGILIILFGLIVRMGMLSQVEAARGMVPIILGAVILLWSWYSQNRRK